MALQELSSGQGTSVDARGFRQVKDGGGNDKCFDPDNKPELMRGRQLEIISTYSRFLGVAARTEVMDVQDVEDGLRDVTALRHERYAKLRTALPFPDLDWTNSDNDRVNLARLRDHAETLANSAIDWYLEKKRGKKRIARTLHWATYVFTILAALLPLLKISTIFESQFSEWSKITAEMSLALAGVAGGLNLFDRIGGYSDDWMRFMATAARLNRALVTFQFKWERAERALAHTGTIPMDSDDKAVSSKACKDIADEASLSVKTSPAAAAKPPPDSVDLLIERTQSFCLEILDILGEETEVWVNAMTQRMGRAETHLAGVKRQT